MEGKKYKMALEKWQIFPFDNTIAPGLLLAMKEYQINETD